MFLFTDGKNRILNPLIRTPESYVRYFRENNVTTIVRLNNKLYDASKFTKEGFTHVDLFFIDGSTPSDDLVNKFLTVSETSSGAVAVHCKGFYNIFCFDKIIILKAAHVLIL